MVGTWEVYGVRCGWDLGGVWSEVWLGLGRCME